MYIYIILHNIHYIYIYIYISEKLEIGLTDVIIYIL